MKSQSSKEISDYAEVLGTHAGTADFMAERLKPYDLEERTALFAEEVIALLKKVPLNPITRRLIDQLTGAATSVGANYREADDAPSRKSFRNSIATCKREAREARFFIRIIAQAVPEIKDETKPLLQEAKELHLIFAKIYRG
ncbi:MAG: four helix bundle protein [Lentisphaeria bacterium]